MSQKQMVFRFKIYLKEIKPMIWRRIEIRSEATFWDLASAIMDVMGWQGYHLFAFEIKRPGSRLIQYIGNPNDDFDEVLPAWEIRLDEFFKEKGDKCDFVYDFGDNWEHTVRLEGIYPVEKNTDYPRCLGGKRACPPEDCGGYAGYYDLLEILENPEDEEYEETVEWLGDDYDPSEFNKEAVVFHSPEKNFGMNVNSPKQPVNDQKVVTKQSAIGDANFTLKDGLKGSLKKDLIIIARNHQLENPHKLKKDELAKRLEPIIQRDFLAEIFFFSLEQTILFYPTSKDIQSDVDNDDSMTEEQKSSLSKITQSIENILSNPKEMMQRNPDEIAYLSSKGYIFIEEKGINELIQVPEELKEILLLMLLEKGRIFFDFQKLQDYIIALAKLYGVCSYKQLHQVFKKHTGSNLTLQNIKDYTMALSERDDEFEAEENYFYLSLLDEDEASLIFEYNLKKPYYFPTEKEIMGYVVDIFCPEARRTFNNLSEILLKKTCISKNFSVVSIDYSEAIEQQDEEILDSYDEMFGDILFAARMGKGLYQVLQILDFSDCKFKQLSDTDKFYTAYLELLEKSRKWPLKGNLYSDLRKVGQ